MLLLMVHLLAIIQFIIIHHPLTIPPGFIKKQLPQTIVYMVALCMTDEIVWEVMDGNMFVNSLHSTHPFSETETEVTTHAGYLLLQCI